MNKFAERLTEMLKVKELSQSELARRLKVNQKTVSNWCNGKREPNLDMLVLICKELEESSDYIIGLEE